MTKRERKQSRIIRRLKKELEEAVRFKDELNNRISTTKQIRKMARTGLLNKTLILFLFDLIDHQHSRYSSHANLNKYDDNVLTKNERWYKKNLVHVKNGTKYFLCVTEFLLSSMGFPERTQRLYFRQLEGKKFVRTTIWRKKRYVYVDTVLIQKELQTCGKLERFKKRLEYMSGDKD